MTPPRSIEIVHRTIKAAYALELKRRNTSLRWNPGDDATPPTVVASQQRRPWWTPEQVGEFLAYGARIEHLPTGLVDMLADTGGRRGEACAPTWPDLDLEAGTYTITRQFAVNNTTNEVEIRPTKRPRDRATIGLHPVTVPS